MSVWLTIPSARPVEEAAACFKLWRERGYKIALWVDSCKDGEAKYPFVDYCSAARYPGYARAVNILIWDIGREEGLNYDPAAEWFIAAGDDTEPDPNKSAEEIARECSEHFHALGCVAHEGCRYPMTFGVMQPTGDRWHEGVGGFTNAPIDRVAGSAWYGREYCRRMYSGRGPLWHEYQHMYVDEEAQEVAIKMGVFWQRRDLTHRHNHWGRGETDKALVRDPVIPPHLEKWNTSQHWQEAKKMFTERKAAGFPGHELL